MYDDYKGTEGNDYRFSDGSYDRHIPDVPQNDNRKKGGAFWKKALAAVALGLLFGAFTGAGIYISGLLTNIGPGKEAEVSDAGGYKAPDTAVPAAVSADTAEMRGALQTTVTAATTGTAVTGALDVSGVVENVMPSVVSITNNYTQTTQDIFGQRYQSESKTAGSGIIVGDNGSELLIVTNQHVVDDANKISVRFIDDSEAEAKLKGEDEGADLAVIAVDKSSLSTDTQNEIKIAALGDSESLKVGQTAIAIGNALGYGQSVTTGVISALNRELTLSNGTHKMIQTDAAINPGNSGGALLDINGSLIGINEAKISGSVAEGMGYAIPISDVKSIIDGLMNRSTKTKISDRERGYLGISGVDVTREISEQYNMPRGVYIAKVGSGLAADNAGLPVKSVITAFDGQSVQTMEQLQSLMDYYRIGDKVEVVVQQPLENDYGYEEKTYTVTLGGTMSMTANADTDGDPGDETTENNGDNGQQNEGYYFSGDPFNDIFGRFW